LEKRNWLMISLFSLVAVVIIFLSSCNREEITDKNFVPLFYNTIFSSISSELEPERISPEDVKRILSEEAGRSPSVFRLSLKT
jgi:hypothetical protein